MKNRLFKILLLIFILLSNSNTWAQRKGEEKKETGKVEMRKVEWETLEGLIYNSKDFTLKKNTGKDGWGDAGAFSKDKMLPYKNGILSFTIQDTRANMAIGLSQSDEDNYPEVLNHGFIFTDGQMLIVDQKEVVGEFGNFRLGDRYRIQRENESILYFYNDINIFESHDDPSFSYNVDLILASDYVLVDYIEVSAQDWDLLELEEAPQPCNSADDYNWVETSTYDFAGKKTSSSRTYADKLGKTLQVQSKHIDEDEIFVAQSINDEYGRPVVQTLSAPIGRKNFCYKPNFVTNTSGLKYSYSDFDKPNTNSSANYTGEIDNPKRVKQDIPNSLGWYYSSYNTDEPLTPITRYPYSRVEYSKSNPGQVRRSSNAGDEMRMGRGHEAESYTMPASSELYYLYGYNMDWNSFQSSTSASAFVSNPINVDYQVIKSIAVDQDEKEYISFTDHDGKVLATCRSGLSDPKQTVLSIIPDTGHIDIHIPERCEDGLFLHHNSGFTGAKFRILNLQNDKYISNGATNLFSYGNQPNLSAGYYRFEHVQGEGDPLGTKISYELNYERFTLHYYDQAKRLIETVPPLGIDEDYEPNGTAINLSETVACSAIASTGIISEDQPSNLLGDENQVAYISLALGLNHKKPDIDKLTEINHLEAHMYDVDNTITRVLSTVKSDREIIKRGDTRVFGINNSNLVTFMAQNEIQSVSILNNANLAQLSTNTTSFSAVCNAQTNAQQTYVEYELSYELGYRNTSGVFVSIKDGLKVKVRRNTRHTPTGCTCPDGHGNTNRTVLYHNSENGAVIGTNHFDDLKKYEAKINNISIKTWEYSSIGNISYFGLVNTNMSISDFNASGYSSNSLNNDYLLLRVANVSQMSEPDHKMKQTNQYNSLNWLLKTTSPDEGTSKFVYRNDGQIRFSQNAKQKELGKFSYTNYDNFARPIESGEHKASGIYSFTDHYGVSSSSGTSTDAIREVVNGFASPGDDSENCWNRSFIKYDIPRTDVPIVDGVTYKQQFVNGNITKTSAKAEDEFDASGTPRLVHSWYSYDHYGRLTWLIRKYEDEDIPNNKQAKVWEYEYDENNGNLLSVRYMPNNAHEAYTHEYKYDNNSRLIEVMTSSEPGNSEAGITQAKYIYYKHGPLKRVELATNLQGIDYLYTINGALKSINNPSGIHNANYDPGKDGIPGGNGFNKDQFAMTLDYYTGDYKPYDSYIRNVNEGPVAFPPGGTPPEPLVKSNYSGSIAVQHWQNRKQSGLQSSKHDSYIYKYDNYNQLAEAKFGSFNPGSLSGLFQSPSFLNSNKYKVNVSYDVNGNISTVERGDDNGDLMDDLAYNYEDETNQLNSVDDTGNSGDKDIEDQEDNNYEYDVSGRLYKDHSQKIEYIYNTQGLVTKVINYDNGLPWVKFFYDDGGFRYKKILYAASSTDAMVPTNVVSKSTVYVRDLSGQVTAIYDNENDGTKKLVPNEFPFYGNSRIGTAKINSGIVDHEYELKDHLGNVRQVIKKSTTVDWAYFKANYYPFGMKFMSINSYRYGYQGEYAEDESDETGIKANSFQLRLYDARIGRWMSPDPYRQHHSPYLAMGNNPISNIDPDGGFWSKFGAQIYRFLHGGKGEIIQDENGNWSIFNIYQDEELGVLGGEFTHGWDFEESFLANHSEHLWYVAEKGDLTSHSFVVNPINGNYYEASHPRNKDGKVVHGFMSWFFKGNKSITYMRNINDDDFWTNSAGGKDRGNLEIYSVFIPNKDKALQEAGGMVLKSYDYNFLSNNCKHNAIHIMNAGHAKIPSTDPRPQNTSGGNSNFFSSNIDPTFIVINPNK